MVGEPGSEVQNLKLAQGQVSGVRLVPVLLVAAHILDAELLARHEQGTCHWSFSCGGACHDHNGRNDSHTHSDICPWDGSSSGCIARRSDQGSPGRANLQVWQEATQQFPLVSQAVLQQSPLVSLARLWMVRSVTIIDPTTNFFVNTLYSSRHHRYGRPSQACLTELEILSASDWSFPKVDNQDAFAA